MRVLLKERRPDARHHIQSQTEPESKAGPETGLALPPPVGGPSRTKFRTEFQGNLSQASTYSAALPTCLGNHWTEKGYNLGMSSLMEAILKNQFRHVSLAVSFTFSAEK